MKVFNIGEIDLYSDKKQAAQKPKFLGSFFDIPKRPYTCARARTNCTAPKSEDLLAVQF